VGADYALRNDGVENRLPPVACGRPFDVGDSTRYLPGQLAAKGESMRALVSIILLI
jgi:hypothetical protein